MLSLATVTMTGQSILLMPPSHAVTATTNFVCGKSQGIHATLAQTKKGDVPIILWKSEKLSKSGYNPKLRCQQVSARFQTLYRSGQLKYLTVGTLNDLPVICATANNSSTCGQENLLYTLRKEENAESVIKNLQNIRNRANNKPADEHGSIESDRSVKLDWLENED